MAPPMADDAAGDLISAHRRCCCCCFWIPSLDSERSSWWGGTWTEGIEGGMRWWKGWDGLRRVKEWSEMVAGPRWKTFLRRFSRRGGGGGGGRHGKYQYDPLSYALNFDDGHGQNGNLEAEYGYCDFSSRYAGGGGKLLVDEEEKEEDQDLGKGVARH